MPHVFVALTVAGRRVAQLAGRATKLNSSAASSSALRMPRISGGGKLKSVILICVVAWLMGSVFLAFTAYLVPHDIATLRQQMRERADTERGLSIAQPLEIRS